MAATYAELLEEPKWREKRMQILTLDGFKCQKCYNQKNSLNFQHSATSIGVVNRLTGSTLYFIIYDKLKKTCERLSAKDMLTHKQFMGYVAENSSKTPVVFFSMRGGFYQLVGICFLNKKIQYRDITETDFLKRSASRLDDINSYLETCTIEDYEAFDWLFLKGLHVHHKYYKKNCYPWEYPNSALTTLCWNCHEDLHKTQKVPYLDEDESEIGSLTPCSRCFGAGWFPEYSHVENGVCFDCRGAKYIELNLG